MAKMDIKQACRNIPVHRYLLGMKWKDSCGHNTAIWATVLSPDIPGSGGYLRLDNAVKRCELA